MGLATHAELLSYWFSDRARPLWFESDESFDQDLRLRFGETLSAAAGGELDGWADETDSCLALIILLDQLTRNLHRGRPRAFENDRRAAVLAETAVARGFDQRVALDRRLFFYMPFQHSEDLAVQRRSLELCQRWSDEFHDGGEAEAEAKDQMIYVRRHLEIIERFGRFPHRNAVLGRESTTEEIAFLAEPISSF